MDMKTFLRSRPLLLLGAALLLVPLLPMDGHSHIVREEPWHPVPAGYLRSLFYLKLVPIDWDRVAREYDHVADPTSSLGSLWDGFTPAAALEGIDHVAAIRGALEARDPWALATNSTTAVSQLTRLHLRRANEQLDRPGAAMEEVHEAARLYRAFDRFVRHGDPLAARALGLAWLELTTSLGSTGVESRATTPTYRARFEAARRTVETYLRANYETGERPKSLDPLPAGAAAEAPMPPWLPPGTDLNDQDPLPRLVLNFESHGVDERDLFLVAYGDMLFDSPVLFGAPASELNIKCSTCHNRSDINQRFFIPGISDRPGGADVDGHFFNPRFNDRRADALDTPSLRGIRFTAPYGRDGRFAGLRDFVRNVIVNEFGGAEPTPLMLDALIAYMLEFDWLPAPNLNPDGTLNARATDAARRGEELFNRPFASMGDRSCSTCHVAADNFVDRRRHDIGSMAATEPGARNAFFDTPTLINIVHTAPYFHDGSLETLADVVAWFDDRYELGLTPVERSDLTAYLEAVGTGTDPYEIFDDENTPFRLFWSELTTFASTLDTLLPARDAEHARLLIATVAPDLRLDASALVDLSKTPLVYEMADLLDAIDAAIVAGDWAGAEEIWDRFKAKEAEYDGQLR